MLRVFQLWFFSISIVSLLSCSEQNKNELTEVSNNEISFKTSSMSVKKNERVSFKIKGTGSKGISVKIGIGYQVGSGSCCSTVSPFTTAGFSGNVGDVVYDSDKKRVITKIYTDLAGTTIDLEDYY